MKIVIRFVILLLLLPVVSIFAAGVHYDDSRLLKKVKPMFLSDKWYNRNGAYLKVGDNGDARHAPLIARNLRRELTVSRSKSAFRTILMNAGLAFAKMPREVIPFLLQRLGTEDKRIRLPYVIALRKFRSKRAVPLIIPLLKTALPELQGHAAVALGDIKDARAVRPLIAMLKHRTWWLRRDAASSLGKLQDSRAVRYLLQLLNDRREGVRSAALKALGKLRARSAAPRIIRLLKGETAFQAADALGKIGGAAAKRALIRSLRTLGRDNYGAKTAVMGLAAIGGADSLTAILRAESRLVHIQAQQLFVETLCKFKSRRIIPYLMKYYNFSSYVVSQTLVRILGRGALPYLRRKFRNPGYGYARLHVAGSLARLGDSTGIAYIKKRLEKDAVMEANWLIRVLKDMKGRAVPMLLAHIEAYRTQYKRATALKALAQIGDARGLPVLARDAFDWNVNIRQPAVRGLGNISDPHSLQRAFAPLIKLLAQDNLHVSLYIETLKSFVRLSGKAAIPVLRKANGITHPRVRRYVQQQLWKMGQVE